MLKNISEEELNRLLLYAERYALGRRTYVVSQVCEMIGRRINDLNKNTVEIMLKDLGKPEYASDGFYGDACDKEDWMKLIGKPKKYQEENGWF